MNHTALLSTERITNGKSMLQRATGRFYTHDFIIKDLTSALLSDKCLLKNARSELRIIDPFCGDGRLLIALIKQATSFSALRNIRWRVSAWDIEQEAVEAAKQSLEELASSLGLTIELDAVCKDTLLQSAEYYGHYDVVITNPPWEMLKPDQRETETLSTEKQQQYRDGLRSYDEQLAEYLPFSQPSKKFAGWGTNLSRCGLELSLNLISENGFCAIVLPSALLTDQVSIGLRKWMLEGNSLRRVFCYPAECRLFEKVDQPSVAIISQKSPSHSVEVGVTRYNSDCHPCEEEILTLGKNDLESLNYCIPLDYPKAVTYRLLEWSTLPRIGDYEGKDKELLWLGRELDETGFTEFVSAQGDIPFIKGRTVDRFVLNSGEQFVSADLCSNLQSVHHKRIAWRDVSRRSQIRRMRATVIPSETVTGNSLHVCYFRDDNEDRLLALLGIFNSIPFEIQVRTRLGTGHVSLGVVRQIHIPRLEDGDTIRRLSGEVRKVQSGDKTAEISLEVMIAKMYGLDRVSYAALVGQLHGLSEEYVENLLGDLQWDEDPNQDCKKYVPSVPVIIPDNFVKIPNHYTSNLSQLDLQMAGYVPPGGNWKHIPATVSSKRVQGIREAFAAGLGSRSTYYGRLHPDKPSYTINTYFNRPGNGCHLHYNQDRVLSEREAARLQSFPDNFVFLGSHASIHKQIGNAVPPLLAYQIASSLPFKGQYVDLFSGAGGLSLGFKWAGWEPIIANDIEESFLRTYSQNIHDQTVVGDIRDRKVFDEIVERVREARKGREHEPLIIIGGPPCQGFSTAGNKRSMEDQRNHLFYEYKAVVQALNPTGFVFENVTGLLSMEGGRVFETIRQELARPGCTLSTWLLQAERYGVPQRRTRVVLVSIPGQAQLAPPQPITWLQEEDQNLFDSLSPAITVEQAISDLPSLKPGVEGSHLSYRSEPLNSYQRLMHSVITAQDFLETRLEQHQNSHVPLVHIARRPNAEIVQVR